MSRNPTTQCTARNRRGERCQRPAVAGATVCRYHGGAAPQVVAAARRRLMAEQVRAMGDAVLAHRAAEGVSIDPIEELTRIAVEMVAFKDALAARVNALSDIRYQSGQGEQLRAEVALYTAALRETGSLLDKIAKLDLEGKRQLVAERFAGEVAQLFTAVFTDLALSEQQQARFPVVVAHHLGRVVAGQLEAGGAA